MEKKIFFEKFQIATSDAISGTETIRIAGDGYLGYWFINSPKMKILAPGKGITINFTDDGGAYAERLENFNEKKYDCIVLPVNSYLRHGFEYKYPGVIVMAISESKGADAIVGFDDILPNGKINDLNNSDLKIVYTSESPSSFLLDLTISDFDFDQLQSDNSWRSEVGSSEEVYKQAKKALKDRSIGDAFVMWEPEVSMAINKLGMKKIWGSDKFSGYIIDVFVFHRDFVSGNPEIIENFLTTYFRVIDFYTANRDFMIEEMSNSTNLDKDVVENMVNNIDWYDLYENCNQQFGIKTDAGTPVFDRMINTIIACANVMERAGNFKGSDLDPYRIINSSFLDKVVKSGIRSVGSDDNQEIIFTALSDNDWLKLSEIGTMRIEPVTFQSGTNRLDYNGEDVIDRVVVMLVNNYPNYRVLVRGHTGVGDPKANKELSLKRAKTVIQRMISVHNINPERLHAEGVGAKKPPKRKPGESERAFRFRMPRVEFILMEGNAL